jgi:hypothetical protein
MNKILIATTVVAGLMFGAHSAQAHCDAMMLRKLLNV